MQQRPPSLRSTTFPIVRPYRKRLPQQPNNPSGRAHTESHQPNRVQIPIETVAPPPPTSRDFVPWRFSAAGRNSAWIDLHPGSRKPCMGPWKSSRIIQDMLFSFNPISLLDLRAHFFTPTRQLPNDVARRGCQGWPSLLPFTRLQRCQATPRQLRARQHARCGRMTMSRGARCRARSDRAATLYSVGHHDPNHDARMRIGGEAPRRRTHS